MYCTWDILLQIQPLDKTLGRTLAQTTLDHLARNNMVRRVGHYNGVNMSQLKQITLGKAKLQNNKEGGRMALNVIETLPFLNLIEDPMV